MIVFPDRFSTALDDCIHVTLGLVIAGAYNEQKQELIDNYGSDIVEKSLSIVYSQYNSLIARF